MKLSTILLGTLAVYSSSASAQTETEVKKDTVKTIKYEATPKKGVKADTTIVIKVNKVKKNKKTRHNCPGCGLG